MLEKNWFIFKGDHHLGPYSSEEMVDKLNWGEISSESLVWKDGSKSWRPFSFWEELTLLADFDLDGPHCHENEGDEKACFFQDAGIKEKEACDELPPPLPPLPVHLNDGETTINKQSLPAIKEEEEPVPPLPEEKNDATTSFNPDLILRDEVRKEESKTKTIEESEESEERDENSDDVEAIIEREFSKNKLPYYAALILVGFMTSFYFFHQSTQTSGGLYGASSGAMSSLKNFVEQTKGKPFRFRLLPNARRSGIYFATNMAGPAELQLILKSKKGRVLSREEIEVRGEADLKNHYATFNDLKIRRGTKFAEGEYSYEIKLIPTGTWSNMKIWSKKESGTISKKSSFLFSSLSQKAFEDKLEKYKKGVRNNLLRPIKDRLENFRTYHNLLSRLKKIYFEQLKTISKGAEIQALESKYNLNIGPVLQELVLDNNRIHIAFLNTNSKESREYEKLMEYGKEIGGLAADMVSKTKKYRRIGKNQRESLKNSFMQKVTELEEYGQNNIDALLKEVESFR